MPGFNTLPAVGGGGGQANMTYVGSVHMETYNRSWAQGGTAGYYALYSANQESGYAYFVGSGVSTGAALNRLINVSHAFTRIDIVAPSNDMVNLYKAKVKFTTVFNNPFDADPSIGKLALSAYPSVITSSGNFVLPNAAMPLINVLVVGGGGAGGNTHCGGGGGGGGIVKLTAIQAVGTTGVTIGGGSGPNSIAGTTYFGNVYALGGGSGGDHSYDAPNGTFANGGGGAGHRPSSGSGGRAGTIQTPATGLAYAGAPVYVGGRSGGNGGGQDSQQSGGGGGGGAGADGSSGTTGNYGTGGIGHQSDITGSNVYYSHGGSGGRANNSNQSHGDSYTNLIGSGGRGAGHQGNAHQNGSSGAVIVRYFIP